MVFNNLMAFSTKLINITISRHVRRHTWKLLVRQEVVLHQDQPDPDVPGSPDRQRGQVHQSGSRNRSGSDHHLPR